MEERRTGFMVRVHRARIRPVSGGGGVQLFVGRKQITAGGGLSAVVGGEGPGAPSARLLWRPEKGGLCRGVLDGGDFRVDAALRPGRGGVEGAISVSASRPITFNGLTLSLDLPRSFDAWRLGVGDAGVSSLLDPALYGKRFHRDFLELRDSGFFDPPEKAEEDILSVMRMVRGGSVEALGFSRGTPSVRLVSGGGRWDFGLAAQGKGGLRRLVLDFSRFVREPCRLEAGGREDLSFRVEFHGTGSRERGEILWDHRDLLGAADGAGAAFAGPSVVQVGPTNRCNLSCIPCWCHSPACRRPDYEEWSRVAIPFDRFDRVARKLAGMGTRSIFLIGKGEPLLHPRIVDMVALVHELGMASYIISNGTALTERMADRLLGAGLDKLGLSLWAATPETYVRLHPGQTGDTFLRIESVLAYLAEKKKSDPDLPVHLEIVNVMSSRNCGEERAMVDFARRNRFDSVYFRPVCLPNEESRFLLMSAEQRGRHIAELERLSRELEAEPWIYHNIGAHLAALRAEGGEEGVYRGIRHLNRCFMGWHYLVVGPGGDLSPCPHGEPLVPEPGARSLAGVWGGKEMEGFRRKSLNIGDNMPYFSRLGYPCLSECCLVPNNELMAKGVDRIRYLAARRRPFRRAARRVRREALRLMKSVRVT